MNISNILCPVDFSDLSATAIAHASSLARRLRARLHFVHVYEPVFADGYIEGMPIPPVPADLDAIRERLQSILPTCDESVEGSSVGDEPVGCQHELIFGFPAGSIVGYAATHEIDLIVMGTHGRTGPSRLLMGSVAEAVMRAASCPVLVVHDAKKTRIAA